MTSRWRLHSRQVIARVLAGLPADATADEKRAAVSAAYPFGERAMLPYKMWLKEVKEALGPVVAKGEATPAVGWTYTTRKGLRLRCDWCRGKMAGGCMMCVEQAQVNAAIAAKPEWRGISNVPPHILADWLDDNGFDGAALAVRQALAKRVKV